MENMNEYVLAGLIGLCMALIKLLEKVWEASSAKRARANGDDPLHVLQELLSKMSGQVHETWDVHLGPAARDEDGVLRWYVPRTWLSTLARVIEMLGAVLALLERERDQAERGERRQERMEQTLLQIKAQLAASDHGRVA